MANIIKTNLSINEALSEVNQMNALVDGLIELGGKICNNKETLKMIIEQIRINELRSDFLTMEDVGEALRCSAKSAISEMKKRGVELIDSGKGYVVNREDFYNACKSN